MKRIDTPHATPDGLFQDADPSSGRRATEFIASWCNNVQEELAGIVETAGRVLDGSQTNQVLRSIIDLIHPIGSYVHWERDDITPSQLYTWQTWVEVTGVVLVGRDIAQPEFNATGKVGGEKTHILSGAESGQLTIAAQLDDGDSQTGNRKSIQALTIQGAQVGDPAGDGTEVGPATVSPSGQQPHNNLQPYRVVRMWRRAA
ncbi:MAG: hypothetical protein QJR02_08425 [Sinobacteraceae bacterium]|nr:hypothetical protein [Nevskiaceae bacterium]